jgi:NADH-quinone oxidoreductase subunit I
MMGLGLLKGLGVTLRELPKKKVTLQYPNVMPKWPERYRGVHEFIPDLCIVCFQCSRICPTNCISLAGQRDENKKMRIDTYDINFEICILCDLCCEVCPTEAIKMTGRFELATYTRDTLYKDMEWLYETHKQFGSYEQLQEKQRQEAEKAKAEASGNARAQAAAPSSQEAVATGREENT